MPCNLFWALKKKKKKRTYSSRLSSFVCFSSGHGRVNVCGPLGWIGSLSAGLCKLKHSNKFIRGHLWRAQMAEERNAHGHWLTWNQLLDTADRAEHKPCLLGEDHLCLSFTLILFKLLCYQLWRGGGEDVLICRWSRNGCFLSQQLEHSPVVPALCFPSSVLEWCT